jgi:hypothetical protein
MLTLNTTITRAPSMVSTEIEDSVVMLDVDLGRYFELNAVASVIWALAEQPCTIAQIHAKLTDEFAVDPDRCERDIIMFITDMIDRKVIIVVN